MDSHKKIARIAGFLYIFLLIFGILAQFYTRTNLIVEGDPALTAQNISSNLFLFRLGLVGDLLSHSLYFLLAITLYNLLKPVSKAISLLFLLMVSINVAIMVINMFNHLAVLLILTDSSYLTSFSQDQLNSVVLFLLNMHKFGFIVAQIYFGGWLIPHGYLVYKSGYFPRIWGYLLIAAGIGYWIDFFTTFLFPGYVYISYPITAIAFLTEFLFGLWLIFKGANIPKNDILVRDYD